MEAVMGVANAMGDMVVNERLTVDGVDVLVAMPTKATSTSPKRRSAPTSSAAR